MTGERPVASVLVPAYNHGPYLRDALEGVVGQAFDGTFEVLVGDDASSDDSGAIASEFAGRYPGLVKVVRRERNIGMHANHADLVARAQGEFIAYCEGDDYWHARDKLQRQVDFLRAHPEVGAVHSDFDRIVPAGGGWKRLRRTNATLGRKVPDGNVFAALLKGNFIQTCTLCVRTALARRYLASGLPIAGYPVGDWPLCLHVAHGSEVAYLRESLAVYRLVQGSATNSGHAARLRTALGYLSMIDSLCDHFGVGRAEQAAATGAIQRAILSLAVLAADRDAFGAAWSWLAANDPGSLSGRRRWLWLVVRSDRACRALAWAVAIREWFGGLGRFRHD